MIETSFPNRQTIARGAEESAKSNHTMLAIFRLGGELLAVDASAVQEIALMARLSIPSGLPAVIAGFLNLAQRPIPVIRLHRLLGLPEPALGLYTHILILYAGEGTSVGWIIDQVTTIVHVHRGELMPVPEGHCFKDCAKAVFTNNGASVCLLAPDRVLLEQEHRCVLEFQAKEEERLRELAHAAP